MYLKKKVVYASLYHLVMSCTHFIGQRATTEQYDLNNYNVNEIALCDSGHRHIVSDGSYSTLTTFCSDFVCIYLPASINDLCECAILFLMSLVAEINFHIVFTRPGKLMQIISYMW
jgi:hypothetical protein